jgi:hypothetical protein
MEREAKVKESVLYEIWKQQNFKNHLKTSDGDEIKVLDPGVFNDDYAGPDFKNARIRIGNLTYVGDIEIDNSFSDWKSHGHNIDNKYTKVILHASLFNKNNLNSVYTRDGRKVPSICLHDCIDKIILKDFTDKFVAISEESITHLKCHSSVVSIQTEIIEKVLYQFGVERFEKKCKRIYSRLKEIQFMLEMNIKEPVISYDLTPQFQERKFQYSDFSSKVIWQQLFYELVFEALGYSKNKTQMLELSQFANLFFLNKIEKDGVIVEKYESALLNISSLMQKSSASLETSSRNYIETLNLHWNSIRSFYDGKLMDETQWHFFRLRPQNFPTIRIAGGARILFELLHKDLIKTLVKKVTEIHNLAVLVNSLRSVFIIRGEGFWKNHYVFDQAASSEIKYFVGASRADEIIVNVVLPFLVVYFEVFGNQNLVKKIFKIYSIYEQKTENQIVNDVSKSLNAEEQMKKTIFAQGMIELFRNFCSKNKCLECEIGKVVFG